MTNEISTELSAGISAYHATFDRFNGLICSALAGVDTTVRWPRRIGHDSDRSTNRPVYIES